MARLLLVPVFAVLLLDNSGQDTMLRGAATCVFVIASATDRLDGEIARRRNLITDFGKIADPIADKALMGTALGGLSALGALPWWVTAVVLVRELGITVLRFWVIRRGVIAASRGGKVKTLAQSLAIGLYLLPFEGWVGTLRATVMGLAVLLTVITGADYVGRALRLRRAGAGAARTVRSGAEAAPGTPQGTSAPPDKKSVA